MGVCNSPPQSCCASATMEQLINAFLSRSCLKSCEYCLQKSPRRWYFSVRIDLANSAVLCRLFWLCSCSMDLWRR